MRRILLLAASALLLTSCLDPTTGRPPATDQPAPAYTSSVVKVTASMLGASWRPGCPVGPDDLRQVTVAFWGYDGGRRTGALVVRRAVVGPVIEIFRRLYAQRFQVHRILPVSRYGGSDDRSMADNNTSAFNCRAVTGGTGWSEHSYGTALDLNPVQNPYISRSGTVLPPNAEPWADRSVRVPGMVHAGDAVVQAFAAYGWHWGGSWTSPTDYQHFSVSGR